LSQTGTGAAAPQTIKAAKVARFNLTIDDIRRAFDPGTFDRGWSYQRSRRVRFARISASGDEVEGEVQGSLRKPYAVSARISRMANGRTVIGSECTCPVGFDCKHAVAVLIQAVADCENGQARAANGQTLSAGVIDWLAQMERAAKSAGEDYPPELRQRLLYLLLPAPGGTRLAVAPASVRQLKGGAFSTDVRSFSAANILDPKPPQYLRPSDYALLRRLGRTTVYRSGDFEARRLEGEEGADLLAQMLATGRCYWESPTGPLLRAGEPRAGTIEWRLTGEGLQRPDMVVTGGGLCVPVAPPWYIDTDDGICGPVETDLAPRMAAMLLQAPALTPAEVKTVRVRLTETLPKAPPPLPRELAPPRRIEVVPVPHLLLHQRRLSPNIYWSGTRRPEVVQVDVTLARLSFLYDGHEVASDDRRPAPIFAKGDAVIEVLRRPQAEKQAMRKLEALGLLPATPLHQWNLPNDCQGDYALCDESGYQDEDLWIDFADRDVSALRAAGWRVELDASFPYRMAQADGAIEAALENGSGIDWFELHLGVPVDGQRVDILPALLKVLRQIPGEAMDTFLTDDALDDTSLRLRLNDGRILPLPFAQLRPILAALAGLFAAGREPVDGVLHLTRTDAADLADFAAGAVGVVWRGDESLRALGRQLKDHAGLPPVALPSLFTGSLRPYQQSGLEWMQLLRSAGLGGVLADDMGLGKTVQTLAHIAVEKAEGRLDRPCLVIAPTSLMPNWQAEAATFAPSLAVLVQHGADRAETVGAIADQDIVFTTYALLARDIEILAAQQWHMVILDEAQFVKNPSTAAAQALRRLDTRHRLALTGTPLENHLGELWALFDFVLPGFLGERSVFTRQWRTPIEKKGDTERRAVLARRVKPFLLRRAKSEVASDLPPKTEIIEHIELSPGQRDLYEAIRLAMHKKVREAIARKGLTRSRIDLLEALLKLRQACCDPRLVKTAGAGRGKVVSAKLARLMEMLVDLIGEGRRVLLFSQFTSMLALIVEAVEEAGIPYVILTGQTTDRATPVKRFQKGEVPLFLISLKAGGTGLNLTAADTVIHYDPWWNPAVEAQATDRAHRLGQDKPVFVHKLIAQNTIEVKMQELKSRKQSLADGLFDPDAGSAVDIAEADIEYLLGQ